MKNSIFATILILVIGLITVPSTLKAQELSDGPDLDPTKDYYAVMETSEGLIFLEFYPQYAPIHVKNFVNLAEGTREWRDPDTKEITTGKPFYDGIKFHRIIKDFMIQGGDPTGTGGARLGFTIPLEVHPELNYDKPYLLAMARTPDPNSASAQFFITVGKVGPMQRNLNQQYTIFGKVMDEGNTGKTIDKLELTKNSGGIVAPADRPEIKSVKIVRVEKGTDKSDVVFEFAKMLKAKEGDADMNENKKMMTEDSKPAASKPASQPASKPASRPSDS